jgi:regulator of protease activity HflC (stomatin/prohibitin superfamily)
MGTAIGAVAAVILTVVVLFVLAGVRIVRPYQRGIVETLGRYRETVDPGLRIIFPVFQKLRIVDLREQVVDVPPQEVITADNVVVSVDAVIYFEPTDPKRLVYNVADFLLAVTKLAQTNLRNVVGDLDLDAALTSRDQINAALRAILDDATDKWGVRVGRVEIQRIDPPADVMSAMHEQMKAERTRRAVVTQADGQRQAAIARAEGEKQSAILTAEGVRHRHIIEAEGEANAIRAVAEAEAFRLQTTATGEADAVRSVYGAIHEAKPTTELIAIKTLEALGRVADGQATTVFVPVEMSGVLASLGAVRSLFDGSATASAHDVGDGEGKGNGKGRGEGDATSGTLTTPRDG